MPLWAGSSFMAVRWTRTDQWHIARFDQSNLGDCDAESAAIRRHLDTLPDGMKVALSFRNVEFVSSRVIGMILAVQAEVTRRKGRFAITSPGPRVTEAIRIAGLSKTLTIRESTNDLD